MKKTEEKIPVLIADDHALVRTGLRIVINNSDDYFVAGEASNGAELLKLLEENRAGMVILDLQMEHPPGAQDEQAENENDPAAEELFRQYSGLFFLRKIRNSWPGVKVLIMTQHDDPRIIHSAVALDVNGFLLKDELNDAILQALESIRTGGSAFSERVEHIRLRPVREEKPDPLSPREREVLQLVSHGFRDREISERLNIAPRTVAFHKANIKEKLNAESTAEIIAHYYSRENS